MSLQFGTSSGRWSSTLRGDFASLDGCDEMELFEAEHSLELYMRFTIVSYLVDARSDVPVSAESKRLARFDLAAGVHAATTRVW